VGFNAPNPSTGASSPWALVNAEQSYQFINIITGKVTPSPLAPTNTRVDNFGNYLALQTNPATFISFGANANSQVEFALSFNFYDFTHDGNGNLWLFNGTGMVPFQYPSSVSVSSGQVVGGQYALFGNIFQTQSGLLNQQVTFKVSSPDTIAPIGLLGAATIPNALSSAMLIEPAIGGGSFTVMMSSDMFYFVPYSTSAVNFQVTYIVDDKEYVLLKK